MAHKRPPLEIKDITASLKESKGQGVGAFFPPPPTNTADRQSAKPPEKTPLPKVPNEPETQKTLTDVMTSLLQDVNLRDWRDTIENTQTRGSSLRLTNEEIYAVEDVIQDLERLLNIKTSMNELARLGLLFLMHELKQNGDKSLVYKVKKS
jgi:hypothetical protein